MAIITDCVVCTIDTILDLDHIEWIAFHCIQSDLLRYLLANT